MNTSLLDRIIALANGDHNIRAVILEGSLTTGAHTDELSDYDINIFSRDYAKYLADDAWMSQIGDVMLYQKEQFPFYDTVIPTRLTIFRDRERVDFSFWSVSLLSDLVGGSKVYESYKNGYQILVDKDGLAAQLKPPDGTGFRITPPDRDLFLKTIYDFWFEEYAVAKYLSRGYLWLAKRVEDSYAKDHLYRMILWHHQSSNRWKPDPRIHLEGKRFEQWASPELIAEISKCFSPYDSAATWNSMFAAVNLFNRLARETAARLNIAYPERAERDVVEYLQYLRERKIRRV